MKSKTALILLICLNLVVCASSQKKIDKAKENDPEYQYNLGLFYLREGNIEEAIRYINKALTLKPEYDNAVYTRPGLLHER